MNWIDLLVLGIAVLSAIFGFFRGFVREVLGVGAWAGAVVAAIALFPFASQKARGLIGNPEIADAAAVAVVFVVTLIVLSLIASAVGSLARNSAIGGLDRTLGLVFGLARGVALVVLAYIAIGLVEAPAAWPPEVLAARSLPFTYDCAAWIVSMLPPPYRPRVSPPPTVPVPGATALLQAEPRGSALDPRSP